MTQILFCVVCFGSLGILYFADKRNNKFLLCTGALVLSLASGLRAENVGIDTSSYINAFTNDFPESWMFPEEGFRAISRFLMMIFKNPTWLFFFYALIICFCVILRFWDFREESTFSYMIFLFLTICFIDTMNIMRQYIAIALVFYATRFLERKKFVTFSVFLLVATTIHNTILIATPVVFIYFWKTLSKKKRLYFSIPLIFIAITVAVWIYKYEYNHIVNYFSQTTENINITFIYKAFIFLMVLFLQYSNKNFYFFKTKEKNYELKPLKINDEVVMFTFIGILLSSLGMFFSFLTRLGNFYLMYEFVFWGKVFKKGNSSQLALFLSIVYAIYVFLLELVYNGSEIFPYAIKGF